MYYVCLKCKYTNASCSVCIMLRVCVFWGLNIWYWCARSSFGKTVFPALSMEHVIALQHACSSSCRTEFFM